MKLSVRMIPILLFVFTVLVGISYGEEDSATVRSATDNVILVSVAFLAAALGVGVSGLEEGYYGRSEYRIYVKKDFGNKIYCGETPVYIYARVVEITPEKFDRRRLDLTRQIEIYSDEEFFDIGPTLISGTYAEASIRAVSRGKDIKGRRGVITVQYRGKSGIYRSNLEFIVDEKRERKKT